MFFAGLSSNDAGLGAVSYGPRGHQRIIKLWSRVGGPGLLIARSRSRPAGAHSARPRLGPRSASNLVLAARRYDYANGGAVIRIVDFTHGTAGPYASMLLAFAFSQLYEKGRALSRRPWRVISCVCSTGNAPPPGGVRPGVYRSERLCRVGGALVPAALWRALGEAVPAVHRPVAPRFEGNLGVLAAFGAHSRVHLSIG